MITLRQFTSICWYAQEILVVDYYKVQGRMSVEEFREIAIAEITPAEITPHALRNWNCVYEELANRVVGSYGVVDGVLIIEVK